MKYVALLRGINVGGKSRVEMNRLKTVFEDVGCQGVSTYINSGNVIFSDERSAEKLQAILTTAIAEEFGFTVPLILRDIKNLEAICAQVPSNWVNNSDQKTDVLFLWDDINDKSILEKIVFKPEIENVRYVEGALVWNIDRVNATKGSSVKLIQNKVYKLMTIRNINTVRKLVELSKN